MTSANERKHLKILDSYDSFFTEPRGQAAPLYTGHSIPELNAHSSPDGHSSDYPPWEEWGSAPKGVSANATGWGRGATQQGKVAGLKRQGTESESCQAAKMNFI